MKNRIPRKRKKAIKNCWVFLDVRSILNVNHPVEFYMNPNDYADELAERAMIDLKTGILTHSSIGNDGKPTDKPKVYPKHLAHNIKLKDESLTEYNNLKDK